MKKILVVAAAVIAAAPAAMASKARVDALATSRQVVDIQTAFDRPYQFMQLSSQATIEWGAQDTVNNNTGTVVPNGGTRAEGGFLMKSEDHAYGVYLGRRSTTFNDVLNIVDPTNANFLREQNPINLFYATKMGEWTVGANVKYSNGKSDIDGTEVSSSGISLGAAMGAWEFEIVQGISGKSSNAATDIESKGLTQLGGTYHIDETKLAYAKYGMAKVEGGGATIYDASSYEVGFVNTFAKSEDVNIFYGIAYQGSKAEINNATVKRESSLLPVWMGLEVNANSWLVVRGSIKQNVLLNETKFGDDKSDIDSLSFAAGLGLKLGNGILDATITTANQGTLGFQDDILSSVAYTHMF